jgi:RNA polymerase sigma-32 factor
MHWLACSHGEAGADEESNMRQPYESASLTSYRADLSEFATLSREAERDLARRFAAGDNKAGEQIVRACLPFVIAIATEYRRWGIMLEDIIQQGNMGLLKAAKKFDPARECRLATYAAYWIRAEIREYVVRGYRVVRLGTTKGERRALRAYRTTQESDPKKLAEMSGLSEARIIELLPILSAREASLDVAANEDGQAPIDTLAAAGLSPEDEAAVHEGQERAENAIAKAMRTLNDRERLIVRERMMNDEPLTLQALGDLLGVSKERVRQLEERARDKLKLSLTAFAHAS